MPGPTASTGMRFFASGVELVRKSFDELGQSGQKMWAGIASGHTKAAPGMKAINAASQELQSGIQNVAANAGSVGIVLSSMGASGVVAAAGIGAAVLALREAFSKTEDAMKFADALEQQAKRLHIGTEELQAWSAAAREADVSDGDLASGLVTVKQKVDEYVAGLMKSRESRPFKLLGLTREDLAMAKDAEGQLLMIAGALEKVDTSQRRGIIEKLGLGALGPLLELGRTRIEEMLAEAHKGGQVLSENITKPLADANKESDKLTKKIGNDWATAFAGLTPLITGPLLLLDAFIQKFNLAISLFGKSKPYDWGKKDASVGAVGTVTVGATGGISVGYHPGGKVSGSAAVGVPLENNLGKIGEGLIAGSVLQPPLPPTAEDEAAAESARKELERRHQHLQQLSDTLQAFIDREKLANAVANNFLIHEENSATVERLRGKSGYYRAVAKMISDSADGEVREIKAAAQVELDQLAKLETAYKQAGEAVPADLLAQRKTIETTRDTKIEAVRTKQGSEAANNARDARGELGRLVDQVKPLDEAFNDAAANGLQNFEDALVGIATGTESVAKGFSRMATSIIADIARMVIQRTVTAPLANWISSGIEGLFGSGHAAGGPVQAGVMYPVNERGTEVFRAGQDGYVLNHEQSVASIAAEVARYIGGGGSPVTVNATYAPSYSVQGGTSEDIADLKRKMAEDRASFPARTVAAVNDGISRRMVRGGQAQ